MPGISRHVGSRDKQTEAKLMRIIGYAPRDTLPAVRVESWFDRRARLWTSYKVDAEGNQLGNALHSARKSGAAHDVAFLQREIAAQQEKGN
jgi:hypothetical protein